MQLRVHLVLFNFIYSIHLLATNFNCISMTEAENIRFYLIHYAKNDLPKQVVFVLVVSGAKINRSIALIVNTELVVLTGQNCIHEDTGQCSHSQAGQADGNGADGNHN